MFVFLSDLLRSLSGSRSFHVSANDTVLFFSYSAFSFYSGCHWIGGDPPTMGRAMCFIQSINSNINLIQKHLHRHTQNHVHPNIWALHGPAKLTHKVNQVSDHKLEKQNSLSVWGSSLRISAAKPHKELTELLTGESALNLSRSQGSQIQIFTVMMK